MNAPRRADTDIAMPQDTPTYTTSANFTTPPSIPQADRTGGARVMASAILVIVALAGILIGMGIDRLWYTHAAAAAVSNNASHTILTLEPPSSEERQRHRDQLAHDLDLTTAQRQQVDSIMAQGAIQFDALRDDVRPRVQQLVDDIRHQIERILTPQQRELFIKMRTEQRR